MSFTSGSFDTSLLFVPRKVSYSSSDFNLWDVVLSAHTFKTLRILHDSTYVLRSEEGNKVFVRLKNSVEYGTQFSSLTHPKAIVSEELIKSLNVTPNKSVFLAFEKVSEANIAKKLCLKLVESFDLKDNSWKRLTSSSLNDNKLDWFADSEPNSSPFPSVGWYNSLLNGDFDTLIKSSLSGCVLFPSNYVLANLKGFLCRLHVKSISSTDPGFDGLLTVGSDTDISVSPYTNLVEPKVKVEDETVISGLDEVIQTFKTHVITPLLSDSGFGHPSGVLLYGPPGCGKSLLARMMRDNYRKMFNTDVELGFKMVQSTDLISNYVGKTECSITELFQELRKNSVNQKMLCFIDEIDILCLSRENTSDTMSNRTLTTFLNNMDGINSETSNFVVVGLTNCLENIDNAMRRPGRFDLEIEVPVPNSKNRLLILQSLLKNVKHTLKSQEIEHVNDFCQAFVGADLKLLVTNAHHAMFNRSREEDKLTLDDFLNSLKVTRPSAMREFHIEVPRVKWDDIGGYEEVKKYIKECVEYPRRFSSLYKKLHIQVPKGILLYGPPGCSKTLMAKAICTESHMNFISIKGPEIFDKYVGESEKNLRKLFSKARLNSPCVLFFDEIDSLCYVDSDSVSRRVLGTLLNELDGVSPLNQVLVIGATNRPQDISKSLLRPGRFDKLIYVPLPDFESRKKIFWLNLIKVQSNFDVEVVSEQLAHMTEGYSGAELVSICKQASMLLLSEVIQKIEEEDDGSVESDLAKLTISETKPLTFDHLKKALDSTKPMTCPKLISFYEQFNSKNTL